MRKQIISYVTEQLETISGLAVSSQTLENVEQQNLPAARVLGLSEEAEQTTQQPAKIQIRGELIIQVRSTGEESVAHLDDLTDLIVPLMLSDTLYGGLVEWSIYSGCSLDLSDNTNDATINLMFQYFYITDFT